MLDKCGIIYVAIGDKAEYESKQSIETVRRFLPDCPIQTLGNQHIGRERQSMSNVQKSRWLKVNLDTLSQNKYNLYLDADTRVYQNPAVGFDILRDGWDLVLTPSANQDDQLLWHVGADDKEYTLATLGFDQVLQMQAGVFWFHLSSRVRRFFNVWRYEWDKFKNQDQGALLRALNQVPLNVWLMGRLFNGGAVVGHLFGRARAD